MYYTDITISALTVVLGLTSSAAAITFSFTTIDVPDLLGTVAQDVNNNGDIVGDFTASRLSRSAKGFC